MRRMIAGTGLLFAVLALPAVAQEHEGHDMDHEMHHAEAPSDGLRAELIADIEALESKFMGLAEAMEGHYDWRPMEGVRSAGEVFGHVANANFMIPSIAGLDREMEDMDFEHADGETMREGLAHSFMHARHSIANIPDAELDDVVNMWGQDATKRQVLMLLVTHMHEHLGQSIAYARSNGVTPPWSM